MIFQRIINPAQNLVFPNQLFMKLLIIKGNAGLSACTRKIKCQTYPVTDLLCRRLFFPDSIHTDSYLHPDRQRIRVDKSRQLVFQFFIKSKL